MASSEFRTVEPVPDLEAKLSGTLLGTAVGDALGLPAERLPAEVIARRFGDLDRFHLLGQTGFVSDDTEQSALVAQSLLRHPDDPHRCAEAFRRSLLGWFLRGPWGIGAATLKACLRILAGSRRPGVPSAGNGAAMRSAIVGVYFFDAPTPRREFTRALASVTHTDPRAIDGALFVAEVAAHLVVSRERLDPATLLPASASELESDGLKEALNKARDLAAKATAPAAAARELGTSGFVLHSVPWAFFCFLRSYDRPHEALKMVIRAGGDTDSTAAIVGAWLGALHGAEGLPAHLVEKLHDGPFGPRHLRALGSALAECRRSGNARTAPGYSVAAALARNLFLLPVILVHGLRRLFP